MKSRFLWLLIFVSLNVIIVLSMGTYYQWVPVSQWSAFYFYLVLMAMLTIAAAIYLGFFLREDKVQLKEVTPEKSTSSQPVVKKSDLAYLESMIPLSAEIKKPDLAYLESMIPLSAEDANSDKKAMTSADKETQTKEAIAEDTQKPSADVQLNLIDPDQILVSDYRSIVENEIHFPLHSYIAGAYIPGTLMDHDPGDLGTQFKLTREGDNTLDKHTIRIREMSGNRIGFIPRPLNKKMALLMDAGQEFEVTLIHKEQVCQSLRLDIEINKT